MAHSETHPPFNHPAPKPLLYGVFAALIFFTILTVATSWLDLGAFGFPIAMLIATIKAALVCAFFMHMWWDKSFNVLFFFSSIFFVGLMIGMTLLDTGQYQDSIDNFPRAAVAETAELPAE